MSTSEIMRRLENFFQRQIAFYEAIIAEPEIEDRALDDPALDRLVEQVRLRAVQTRQLEEECRLLLADWNAATDLTGRDRQAIRTLADRTEALARSVQERNDAALERIDLRLVDIARARNEARQGRDAFDKYTADRRKTGGEWMDRKA